MSNADTVSALREITLQRQTIPRRTPPSRLLWFITGLLSATAACVVLYSLGLRVPPLGFGVAVKPGLESITGGMDYEEVIDALGPEDGVIRASELASYDASYCSACPASMAYAEIEAAGGQFLFWLSRSNGLLVFNIVAFDKNYVVVDTRVFHQTFFGTD